MNIPWWLLVVGVVFLVATVALGVLVWAMENPTTDGERDPYQSRPHG
jgi:nitrogen fixation-related uncharacterized protein